MTLEEYRIKLVWSVAELARRSGLAPRTVARVENGEPVYLHTVAAIAKALSEALGHEVAVDDIEGIKIIR